LVEPFVDENMLVWPVKWRAPRKIFVCSQTDLFGEWVPDEQIRTVFRIMVSTPRHSYQVLTKRISRAREFFDRLPMEIPNVWLGVSVEDQTRFEDRVPELMATRAAVRFISYEPALGPIDCDGLVPEWVIAGGESGAGARPAEVEWFRDVRDQVWSCGGAFFMKQLGGVRNKREKLEDLPDDLRIREFPGEAKETEYDDK
jgi:protein gp37